MRWIDQRSPWRCRSRRAGRPSCWISTSTVAGAGADSGPAVCTGTAAGFHARITRGDRRARSVAGNGAPASATAPCSPPPAMPSTSSATRYQKLIRFGYVEFPGAGNSLQPAGRDAARARSARPASTSPPSTSHCTPAIKIQRRPARPRATSGPRRRPRELHAGLFRAHPTAPKRYVLLVSNGRPDCGTNQNSGCMDAQNVVDQLARRQRRDARSSSRRASSIRTPPIAWRESPSTAARDDPPYSPSGVEPGRADRRDRRHHARDGAGRLPAGV